MTRPRRFSLLTSGAALLTSWLVIAVGATSASAATNVTSVTGSAFGFSAFGITLFGGAQSDTAPTPAAKLASNASNSPQAGSATTGLVVYGPATMLTSDAIAVNTAGSLGSTGSVTSTSSVKDINKATTQQASTGSEVLTADSIAGSCSASASGTTGSTTVTNGTMATVKNQNPPDTIVNIPSSPAPNTTISGVLHISATATDSFHYVFNEQSTSGGVLTVNPVHEYFDGPIAHGNLIIGQVVCAASGVAAANTTSPSGSSSGSSTVPGAGSGGGIRPGSALVILGVGLISAAFLPERRTRRAKGSEREAS